MIDEDKDIELERCVLGALLLEGSAVDSAQEVITADDFKNQAHRTIFETICELKSAGKIPDLYSVAQLLNKHRQLEKIGGSTFLMRLGANVGTAVALPQWLELMKKNSTVRTLAMGISSLQSEIFEGAEATDLVGKLNGLCDSLLNKIAKGEGARHVSDVFAESLNQAESRAEKYSKGQSIGVPTGLSDLDIKLCGFNGGELVILAGRPGSGKTSLLLSFAKAAAMGGVPVCIYSLEMTDIRLADRLLLSECENVSAERYRRGELDATDWHELEVARGKLNELPIYIDPRPVVNISYIRAHSMKMKKEGKCGIIFVDYLQICDMPSVRNNVNKADLVGQTTRMAKMIAKELDVPFVLLSQLNREVEATASKMPMLSHLRDSGSIEQDADKVLFCYRPEYYGIEQCEIRDERLKRNVTVDTHGMGLLKIAKSRDGSTGLVPFSHNESLTKIYDFTDRTAIPDYDKRTNSSNYHTEAVPF